MKVITFAMLLALLHTSTQAQPADSSIQDTQYPVDAALFQHSDGSWYYKSFPSGSRLFVYDGDSPGKSNCNQGCASAWPPLYVSKDNATQVGHWTVIARKDGTRQWAYKGQPVYRRYHDLPGEVTAKGFHVLEP